MTLINATIWKAILQPATPMTDFEAISTALPPKMEPRFAVSCNNPKAKPRLLASVESATRD